MSFSIYLYNFKKRINSTKQPSLADGLKVDVVLKRPTTEYAPVFVLSGVSTFSYNYLSWGDRYYFIEEVTVVSNDIDEIRCKLDVMATFKSEIGNTKCFIEYAASGLNTGRKFLPDPRVTMSGPPAHVDTIESTSLFSGDGVVVVTVAGKNTHHLGFATPFILSDASLTSLANKLYSDDLLTDLQKFFSDPYAAIIEAHWVPWHSTGTADTIMLGSSSSGVSAYDITFSRSLKSSLTLNIPWYQLTNQMYVTRSPYTKFKLHLPYYGELDIPPEELQDSVNHTLATSITINYAIDYVSGELVYHLFCGLTMWQKTLHCSCGVQLPIGQTTGNTVKGAVGAVGGAVATGAAIASMIASGGASVPLIATAAGGIGAAGMGIATAFTEEVSGGGSYGSFAAHAIDQLTNSGKVQMVSTTWLPSIVREGTADYYASNGYPYFSGGTISNFSGYIKCSSASVAADTGYNEISEINTLMNQGFYYE